VSYELKWLIYTIVLTSVLWLPYVLNRIIVQGLIPALGYPTGSTPAHSPWAERAMKAHANAVENLVLFAPLVLAIHILGISTDATRLAVVVYFSMRLLHYFVYVFAVPVVRTLVFTVSWIVILVLALSALGVI
jgi:uncharacterized MAPEG superfamily protein